MARGSQQNDERARLAESLVLAICYVTAGALGHLVAAVVNITAVWPPSGIALAALVFRGRRLWPGVLLGAFVETTRMFLDTSSPSRLVATVLVGACIGGGCTLEALVAAHMLQRVARPSADVFAHVRGVIWFAVLGMLASTLGALIGTTSLLAGHLIPMRHYPEAYFTWWLGDTVGILVWTPLIVTFATKSLRNVRWLEIGIQQLVLFCFQWLFLGGVLVSTERYPLAHLLIPFLVWAGVRLGPCGTVLAILNLSVTAFWATIHGFGPFVHVSLDTSLILVQMFIGNVTMTTLVLSAVIQERTQAESALSVARAELERRVEERTAQLAEANQLLEVEIKLRRESEERYRILVDVNPDGVAVLTSDECLKDRQILYANPAAVKLVRGELAAVVGTYSPQWVPRERQEAFQAFYLEIVAHGRTGPIEDKLVRADGTLVDVEVTGAIMPWDGKATVLLVMRDITRRKQVEDQREQLYRDAAQSIRARDEFLDIASHELKTPLTSLTLQLQGIGRKRDKGVALDPKIASALDVALRQTTRLNMLVDHLLDISRIMQGRLKLTCECIDLSATVREVVVGMQQMATRAGCPIHLHEKSGAVMGRWDRSRLRQVIINILSNAIKYGCRHPVDVDVLVGPDEQAMVSIRDHGIGIPPEHQARIFDQFERAVSVNEFSGFGLGLWITHRIIEAHGGKIVVESIPGEGSTFIVILPRSCAESEECRR